MFGINKKTPDDRTPRREGMNALNIISQGTQIAGNITSQGDVRIDGELIGNIIAHAKIVVGPTGSIFGDIICENADISGKVEGTIRVKELLQLKESANVSGDIDTNKMVVDAGAMFNGRSSMNNAENFNFELPHAEKAGSNNSARATHASKSAKAD